MHGLEDAFLSMMVLWERAADAVYDEDLARCVSEMQRMSERLDGHFARAYVTDNVRIRGTLEHASQSLEARCPEGAAAVYERVCAHILRAAELEQVDVKQYVAESQALRELLR